MRMMVSITFNPADRAQIMPLAPQERARIAELREVGRLETLYLAADGSRGWLVFRGDDEAAVQRDMESLPHRHFVRGVTYTPLRD